MPDYRFLEIYIVAKPLLLHVIRRIAVVVVRVGLQGAVQHRLQRDEREAPGHPGGHEDYLAHPAEQPNKLRILLLIQVHRHQDILVRAAAVVVQLLNQPGLIPIITSPLPPCAVPPPATAARCGS